MKKPKKSEEVLAVEKAINQGRYMLAIWNMEGDQITLYRKTDHFPVADFETAITLLRKDLLRTD